MAHIDYPQPETLPPALRQELVTLKSNVYRMLMH